MLIPLSDLVVKYDLKIKGVIQVGAHYAEEHDVFKQLGVNYIIYIEPCKEAFDVLRNKFSNHDGYEHIRLMKFACGDKEQNDAIMFASNDNQGQSNSLLKPNLHLQQHPEVRFHETELVNIVPLDKIMASTPVVSERTNYNTLMMDCQGAEGLVLKGATETLKHIDIIYTEVNRGQTYEGNMEIDEMDAFLFPYGFERVVTYWPSHNWTWGDAFYIKK